MKDFRKFQKVRIITKEGTIANGDYITDDVVIRCKNGLLCDLPGKDGALLPAIETRDGSHREHWKDGLLHCEDAPAIVDNIDDYELWFKDGVECLPKR